MSLLTLSGTCITTNVLEVWNQSQERFWPNNMFQSSMMFSLDILHLFWGLVSFHSLSWFVHGIFLIIYFGFLCLLTWSTDSQTLLWPGSDAGQTKLRQGCRGGYAIKLHVFKVEAISKNGANAKKWTFGPVNNYLQNSLHCMKLFLVETPNISPPAEVQRLGKPWPGNAGP